MASNHTRRSPRRQANWEPGFEAAAAGACAVAGLQLISHAMHLPFDVMRTQHAEAVHAGLMANSILESRDFEKTVDALEHITLGPFARNV
jgi:hypothetical protein